jgi:hypothetical protein
VKSGLKAALFEHWNIATAFGFVWRIALTTVRLSPALGGIANHTLF